MTLAAAETLELTRKLSFKDLSTRTHHPGKHTVTLIVNGRRAHSATFVLT